MKHLSNPIKAAVAIYVAAFLSACATSYPHPDSIVLQQPVADQALIYFLRAPYDSGSIAIESNGKRLVELPPSTYTVLSLLPGQYRFITTSTGLFGGGDEIVEPLEVVLKPNDRVFFHVSGTDEPRQQLSGVIPTRSGLVPLFTSGSILKNRVWRACNELDARGLITISRRQVKAPL